MRWRRIGTFMVAFSVAMSWPVAGAAAQVVLLVPGEYPTIQAAIDAANDADVVQVAPGTYVELVDFLGKNITVESTDGRDVTVIDGAGAGPVVTIIAEPGESPVFRGFTVTGGGGSDGSGIVTYGGPALIEQNLVRDNVLCTGSGIQAAFSAAIIQNNVVFGNHQVCSGGPGGGGIGLLGAGTARALNNLVYENSYSSLGGGIGLFAAGAPTVDANVITGNSAIEGGGISVGNTPNAVITNNVIAGNSAAFGGGVWWLGGETQLINNAIVNNSANLGSAVFADGMDAAARIANNILLSEGAGSVLECGDFNDTNPPIVEFNDVVASGSGLPYGGICSDQTGLNGNVSIDPSFVDGSAGDYHLSAESPLIDAGTNDGAPSSDFEGEARPQDGNGDGVALADIGADEVATPSLVITQNTTLSGDHQGPVVVAVDGITLDCAGHSVKGPGSVGINLDSRQRVTVRNCTVEAFDVGFLLTSTANSRLLNNAALSNSATGYFLENATGNVLTGNTAASTGGDGFLLSGASGNRLVGNISENNGGDGISLFFDSNDNTVQLNKATGNSVNGFQAFESHGNRLLSNSARRSGQAGFYLWAATGNTLSANIAQANASTGIAVDGGSNGNFLTGNNSSKNLHDGFGVGGSFDNRFVGNRADENLDYGFDVVAGSSGNRFTRNSGCGNGIADAFEDGSGTGNVWKGNEFCVTDGFRNG